MMRRSIIALTMALAGVGAAYLAGAFIAATWDISAWGYILRASTVFVMLLAAIALGGLGAILTDEDMR